MRYIFIVNILTVTTIKIVYFSKVIWFIFVSLSNSCISSIISTFSSFWFSLLKKSSLKWCIILNNFPLSNKIKQSSNFQIEIIRQMRLLKYQFQRKSHSYDVAIWGDLWQAKWLHLRPERTNTWFDSRSSS